MPVFSEFSSSTVFILICEIMTIIKSTFVFIINFEWRRGDFDDIKSV